ncbi:hypothetical protein AJ80_02638 [Polytolypa hystricis UAMH7299]|uniref:F-box domain-containing protein n=1 Tax=Polytolypa hystricis (strain UAMH7299) TaxID=1447883 RepID=A0A2B7YQT5_POLH7|nr:hypothetical protein AJ80_02638 [Polytolypa hystricis UAMH7299]
MSTRTVLPDWGASLAEKNRLRLPSLPRDIFLIILGYLDFMDIVYCRRVSRSWHSAFTNPHNLYSFLKWTFPFAREVRNLQNDNPTRKGDLGMFSRDGFLRNVFDPVVSRYFHLLRGKPRSVEKYDVWPNYSDVVDPSCRCYPVHSWELHKSHANERLDFKLAYTFWTYEDGLLVFPSTEKRCFLLVDLETNQTFTVPFAMKEKVIRRVRMQCRLLVIEWAEEKAFHWLNDSDGVHRHFASAFDIQPSSAGWEINFRNEWKIMFLGHPLGDRDRFYSSHTGTHYVIYTWQPNRSLYTSEEDAPIESLFICDISEPSDYRPSLDPAGNQKASGGPFVVARFSFRDLDFYSVRQRGTPGMMRLDLNSKVGVLDITENSCAMTTYPLTSYSIPLSSRVHVTSIPFIGHGPCWRRKVDITLPPYRGNCSMQVVPAGPMCDWYDCISEVVDEQAQLGYTLHFGTTRRALDSVHLTIHTPKWRVEVEDEIASTLSWKGIIHGDERFIIGENHMREIVILRFDK